MLFKLPGFASVLMEHHTDTMKMISQTYIKLQQQQVSIKIKLNKKAVLPQGNRAMPQVFFSVEVRQQHSLQV